jgi:hypothetical protein
MEKSVSRIILSLAFLPLLLIPLAGFGENITITTDRDVYIAGDRLYFSLLLSEPENCKSDYGYIELAGMAGYPVFKGCVRFDNGMTNGSVYLADTLVTGIYRLVSSTNTMRNSGPDRVARKYILIVNRFDRKFQDLLQYNIPGSNGKIAGNPEEALPSDITLNKNTFRQREKVDIRIRIPDSWDPKRFSLTVRQKAPLSFSRDESQEGEPALTESCGYLPEKSGMVLQGKLKDTSGAPVGGGHVYLSCVDTLANLQQTITGRDGIFRFFLNPYYFAKNLVVKSDNAFNGSIETDGKFLPEAPLTRECLRISGDLDQFLEKSQKYLTIRKSYLQEDHKEEKADTANRGYRPVLYDVATETVYPADFTYLPDFNEISREILPLVKTRKSGDGYVSSIINLSLNEFTDMFIFVDGVLIEDVNQIMYFDSKIARKIETLPNIRFLGELRIPNILSIQTANREINRLSWKHPVVRFQADSILRHAGYLPPAANTLPDYIPDFRQLLLWQPSLITDKDGYVNVGTWSSDCTGEFEIILSGTDEKGNSLVLSKDFTVNHP